MLKPTIVKLPTAIVPFESSRDYACAEYTGVVNLKSEDEKVDPGDAGAYIMWVVVGTAMIAT